MSRCISKKTSKLRVTGICAGNSPATGEFPAQRASNAENVSIWWRHHTVLSPLVLRLAHSGRNMSISWLLMSWVLESPGHQQLVIEYVISRGAWITEKVHLYTPPQCRLMTENASIFWCYKQTNNFSGSNSALLDFCEGNPPIPPTEGQQRGKCFHGMTSSCVCAVGSTLILFCCGLVRVGFTHILQGYLIGTGQYSSATEITPGTICKCITSICKRWCSDANIQFPKCLMILGCNKNAYYIMRW